MSRCSQSSPVLANLRGLLRCRGAANQYRADVRHHRQTRELICRDDVLSSSVIRHSVDLADKMPAVGTRSVVPDECHKPFSEAPGTAASANVAKRLCSAHASRRVNPTGDCTIQPQQSLTGLPP